LPDLQRTKHWYQVTVTSVPLSLFLPRAIGPTGAWRAEVAPLLEWFDAELLRVSGAGLGEPRLVVRYSGDSADVMGRAPAYFNYGFVAFSREAFTAAALLQASYSQMSRVLTGDSFFLTQVSLSL
jgi:hypothetical protein